jgi:glycosyltransferase involved in cell wall biosynthesis
MEWCVESGTPIVLLSESAEGDFSRNFVTEKVKSRIVNLASAALVGGARHRDYLVKLGMAPSRIFLGYDVVDNDHFSEGASRARQYGESERRRLGLPPEYFVTCCRFGAKKNLDTVIAAYARYRELAKRPWALVMVGDGELRPSITALVGSLGLQDSVILAGAKGYSDLPAYYALAGCFVHASSTEQWGLVVNEAMAAGLPVLVSETCNCTPELVQEDINGYTFRPTDTEGLAHLMLRVSADSSLRQRLGEASTTLVSNWGPRKFAAGLAAAVRVCRQKSPRRRSATLDRLLVRSLVRIRHG